MPIPAEDVSAVFPLCVSGVRNSTLRGRLASVEADIIAAANEFQNASNTTTLHLLPRQPDIRAVVSGKEMVDLYNLRMAKKGTPGRPVYDRLLASPRHGRGPLCGLRVVSTLDHHMPKGLYAGLTVVPSNLVPSCKDCNYAKGEIVPQRQNEQTLHPYFDDVGTEVWLYAQIIESSPAGVRFYVDPPEEWSELKSDRLRHHFKLFGIADLYGSHGAEELVGIRDLLRQIFDAAGPQRVREQLEDLANSYSDAQINSWQAAMFKALALSDWFCEGGFR